MSGRHYFVSYPAPFGRASLGVGPGWLHVAVDTIAAEQRDVSTVPGHQCADSTRDSLRRGVCETWHCPACHREMPWCHGCGCIDHCACEELCDHCWTPLACATEAA